MKKKKHFESQRILPQVFLQHKPKKNGDELGSPSHKGRDQFSVDELKRLSELSGREKKEFVRQLKQKYAENKLKT